MLQKFCTTGTAGRRAGAAGRTVHGSVFPLAAVYSSRGPAVHAHPILGSQLQRMKLHGSGTTEKWQQLIDWSRTPDSILTFQRPS